MSLVSWKHNDRRHQWEATDDDTGTVVASITDEALDMMPTDDLREFWASAIFIRKRTDNGQEGARTGP